MQPLFAVGSLATVNGEDHVVQKYHRIGKRWEILFRRLRDGKHVSVPLVKIVFGYLELEAQRQLDLDLAKELS